MWGGHFQGFVRVTLTFYCDCFCFSLGVQGLDVEQSPPALTPQEGSSSALWCNFSTSADSMLWYLQKPPGAASSSSFTFLQEQGKEED